MNMSITKKDGALLIGLLGVVIIVLTYFYVYKPYSEKAEALKKDNEVLKTRVDILQQLANNKDDMEKDIAECDAETQQILDRFPSNVLEEDVVMIAVDMQNTTRIGDISGINIELPKEVYVSADINPAVEAKVQELLGATQAVASGQTGAEGTAEPAPAEPAAPAAPVVPSKIYTLYNRTSGISFTTGYIGLKEAVNYLLTRYDKSDLELQATYDVKTGLLSANISLISSYLTGTDKMYTEPSTPVTPQGTENIFGSIEATRTR